MQPRDVERAEAAHRDPADRGAARVGAELAAGTRDRLASDPRAPLPVAAIVVVGAVAAVDHGDDRGTVAQRGETWIAWGSGLSGSNTQIFDVLKACKLTLSSNSYSRVLDVLRARM